MGWRAGARARGQAGKAGGRAAAGATKNGCLAMPSVFLCLVVTQRGLPCMRILPGNVPTTVACEDTVKVPCNRIITKFCDYQQSPYVQYEIVRVRVAVCGTFSMLYSWYDAYDRTTSYITT